MIVRWINKYDRGSGRSPWAYIIDRPFPVCIEAKNGYYFRSIYDCFGFVQGGIYQARCTEKTNGGYSSFYVQGYGFPCNIESAGLGVINDIRTIEMIATGCCPPAIMIEFLSAEGVLF